MRSLIHPWALRPLALALLLAWPTGCGDVTDALNLRIVRADRDTFQGADTLRITVLNEAYAQVVPPLELSPSSGAKADFATLLPRTGTVRFLVEALQGSTVVARGGSAFVTLGEGDLDLAVLVGRVDTFHATLGPEGLASELPFPLAGASATRLKDGRVLIVGGASLDSAGALTDISNRALLYDPNQGTFVELASELRIRRAFHTATLLKASSPGGPQRVLIAGGLTLISGERIESTRLAEIFDPVTGAFTTQLLEMRKARYGHTATLLVSGDVLVAGGGELASGQLITSGLSPDGLLVDTVHADADVFRFSDTTPSFAATPATMAEPRIFHVAGRGSGNFVLVAGGESLSGVLSSTEIYNPDGAGAGTFAGGQDMVEPRAAATLTRLNSGALLVVGGRTARASAASASSRVERYTLGDTAPGEIAEVAVDSKLTAPRYRHQAVLLADGQQVLILGGLSENGFTRTSAELIADGSPTVVIPDAGGRIYHDAARLLSADVLVVGGITRPVSGGVQPQLEGAIYTPALVGD